MRLCSTCYCYIVEHQWLERKDGDKNHIIEWWKLTQICSCSSKSPPNIPFHYSVRYLKYLRMKTEQETKFIPETIFSLAHFSLCHFIDFFLQFAAYSRFQFMNHKYWSVWNPFRQLKSHFPHGLVLVHHPNDRCCYFFSSFSTSALIWRISYPALCMCNQTRNDIAMLLEQFLIPANP